MIAIVDYGVGNLFSLKCSLDAAGGKAFVSGNKEEIKKADGVILPGVGAFKDAAEKLKKTGLGDTVIAMAKSGVPLLGICLGMQLLFEKSHEFGEHSGLGLIPGVIEPIEKKTGKSLKIPHIGWNALKLSGDDGGLFDRIKNGDHVYFVHSYYADTSPENIIAYTSYGADITAAVRRGNIFGCQFHPEKSGDVGINILKAFCAMKG